MAASRNRIPFGGDSQEKWSTTSFWSFGSTVARIWQLPINRMRVPGDACQEEVYLNPWRAPAGAMGRSFSSGSCSRVVGHCAHWSYHLTNVPVRRGKPRSWMGRIQKSRRRRTSRDIETTTMPCRVAATTTASPAIEQRLADCVSMWARM